MFYRFVNNNLLLILYFCIFVFFFFSSRRRHTRSRVSYSSSRGWSGWGISVLRFVMARAAMRARDLGKVRRPVGIEAARARKRLRHDVEALDRRDRSEFGRGRRVEREVAAGRSHGRGEQH